jgi:cytochrome c-type biogenesis protein CcmF
VVSLNNTGMLISKDLPTEFNRDNLLLFVHEPRVMAGYEIEYLGERVKPNGIKGYVNKNHIDLTDDPYKVIATRDVLFKGKKILNARDTFEINPENTFYEVELRKNGKVAAVLFPRVQINPAMGGFVASPDIERHASRDLYTHVSLPMNREEEPEWSELTEERVKLNQQFFVNDYVAALEEVVRIHEIDGFNLDEADVAVKAKIKVKGERDEYFAEPVFLIRNKSQVGRIPAEINDLGVKITLLNIHPDTGDFSLGINTRQKDWVIIKAIEMPLINVLWLGTGVLMIGFTVAMVRRFKDFSGEK